MYWQGQKREKETGKNKPKEPTNHTVVSNFIILKGLKDKNPH